MTNVNLTYQKTQYLSHSHVPSLSFSSLQWMSNLIQTLAKLPYHFHKPVWDGTVFTDVSASLFFSPCVLMLCHMQRIRF